MAVYRCGRGWPFPVSASALNGNGLGSLLLGGQCLAALLADSRLGGALDLVAHTRRPAIGADDGYVRDVDRRFLLGDSALGPLALLARPRLLDNPHMLDEHRVLVWEDTQHAAGLAAVGA